MPGQVVGLQEMKSQKDSENLSAKFLRKNLLKVCVYISLTF